jgi:hypothetical protein
MTDGVPIVLRKTLAARDTPTKGVPGRLIRYQQPKDCLQSNASLAHERYSLEFRTLIGIGSGKPHACDVSRKRSDINRRRMLLRSHFTFPLALGTVIASKMIKDRAAPKHPAVAQHRDARLAAVHAVEQFCGY